MTSVATLLNIHEQTLNILHNKTLSVKTGVVSCCSKDDWMVAFGDIIV